MRREALVATNTAGHRSHARVAGLVFALVLVFSLLGTSSAFAITRATVLARAQTWMDRHVHYSQHKTYRGYRTDCSGYASMCWATSKPGWSTSSFHHVTHKIKVEELKPGDALHKVGHIRIFYGWVDDAHTMYVAYEQTSSSAASGTVTNIKLIANDLAAGYHPCRYNHIQSSPASTNLLRNGSFDVWALSRTTWRNEAVWWSFSGSHDTTVTAHLKSPVKGTRNSLSLLDPSRSKAPVAWMSQVVTITAETSYAVSAWARTPCDPAGLEFRFEYLNSLGASILTTHTHGEAAGLDGSSFHQMSMFTTAPADAVRARVTVRLAGGTTTLSATETVPGTSAILDEISLVRPQSKVTIKASAGHSHIGGRVALSGTVTPAAAIGRAYVLWVHKPGSSAWVRYHTHNVYSSGGAAAWRCVYSFKKGMRKGVYRFKAQLPAFSWWLGTTTGSVNVRLK
jgi:hypothetical protein